MLYSFSELQTEYFVKMATIIPITLVGDNLGMRHKYLNIIVNETSKKCSEFDAIKNIPEKSPIDRLFKIDVASKLRNVEYILRNIKDDDMFYVSRALKSKWLLEKNYEDIINPEYLEQHLYPQMITTAVTKIQHWIHLNIYDETRCKLFFEYYQTRNFDLAFKFFLKCSKSCIESEFKTVIYKIRPHKLKVLCEKCPQIANIFFNTISIDLKVKRLYLSYEEAFYDTLRHLLKTDTDMVLDITEKYYNQTVFKRFSADHTKFIMKHQRDRFWKKPELYTRWLLNTQAVADSLNSEDAKKLVLLLARALYLTYNPIVWFSYQRVEPIIKRLNTEELAAFKKKVFVEKDIGDTVAEWPYDTPKAPVDEIEYDTIFDDRQPEPSEYNRLKTTYRTKRLIRKKCGNKKDFTYIEEIGCNQKTLLDKLFDEFRFDSFGKTLYELRKRIAAESSSVNRQYMMLVLISKSGGRPDAIASLLELLECHVNETANLRATIIRSLVKRTQLWRLPETSWNQLLKFGHGLGLDGKPPEADCDEGLHAVIIRSLLTDKCDPDIRNIFVSTHFSTLAEYSLDIAEKRTIATRLPKILFFLIHEWEENIFAAVDCIEKLIQTLETYKIKLETYPCLIDTIARFANKEMSHVDHIIDRLFRANIARKQLFQYTFYLYKTNESYINALRHDTKFLDAKAFAKLYGTFILGTDGFLRKLSLYFGEENGLANAFLQELKAVANSKIHGRLLAFLLNNQLESYLNELDALANQNSKLVSSAIRANAHLSRPNLDINSFGWKKIGANHIGNKLMICKTIDVDNNIQDLLKFKRTARIALALSARTKYQTEVFIKLAKLRPTIAIKTGLKLLKLHNDKVDPLIWETIKPIIQKLDVTKTAKRHIVRHLENIDEICLKIRPEYGTVIYTTFLNISLYDAMFSLCNVEILLAEVDSVFVEDLVAHFLNDTFIVEKLSNNEKEILCNCMYVRIFVKFLLLCNHEDDQKRKILKYLDPFLATLHDLRISSDKNEIFKSYFREMLLTLKYTKVFQSNEYVSPLPVIENIIVWMRKIFAVDKKFSVYAQLHMLMLYYKSTQEALRLLPSVFTDAIKKRNEGVQIVGKIFGKYVASEVNKLQAEYFESMPELYIQNIDSFLNTYNPYFISSDLLISIITGIFEEKTKSANRLGIYLMTEKHYNIRDDQFKILKNYVSSFSGSESEWFACALLET